MMGTLDGAPYGQTETGAAHVEATQLSATMAWVEQVVASSAIVRATKYEFYTLNGMLWIKVEGAQYEAHAWHVAVGGRAFPSSIDKHGVRRQMILGGRVGVEVIDDPNKRTTEQLAAELRAAHDEARKRAAGAEWREQVAADVEAAIERGANERGGINTGIALIVGCVGLFLFGLTHGNTVPDGHWLLGMLIVGLAVFGLVTFGRNYRQTERNGAAYTENVEGRTQQHQGSEHHQDGVA